MTKITIVTILSLFIIPLTARAGEGLLFFSSAHGVYQVGKDFSTRLMVNSGGGKGINAAKAEFDFDPKLLKIKGVRKTNSIFSLWPEEVKFDNKKGSLTFAGGSPKVYKGGAGLIFEIDYTLLNKGKSVVSFGSSTVLTAEESPKDILREARAGNFTIGSLAEANAAKDFTRKYVGRILLQVEGKGEAWYVNPNDNYKYFLGRPEDAFNIMRKLGLGVKHGTITGNTVFPAKLSGKILLDVEDSGKAYYIFPLDRKAYYLGRPADAFQVMREKGLGISNEGIFRIKDWVI